MVLFFLIPGMRSAESRTLLFPEHLRRVLPRGGRPTEKRQKSRSFRSHCVRASRHGHVAMVANERLPMWVFNARVAHPYFAVEAHTVFLS